MLNQAVPNFLGYNQVQSPTIILEQLKEIYVSQGLTQSTATLVWVWRRIVLIKFLFEFDYK